MTAARHDRVADRRHRGGAAGEVCSARLETPAFRFARRLAGSDRGLRAVRRDAAGHPLEDDCRPAGASADRRGPGLAVREAEGPEQAPGRDWLTRERAPAPLPRPMRRRRG